MGSYVWDSSAIDLIVFAYQYNMYVHTVPIVKAQETSPMYTYVSMYSIHSKCSTYVIYNTTYISAIHALHGVS